MQKKKPIQPQDKYVLRLPDGMRDRIKAAAERNNRSMNAEIVATLEEAYPENEFDLGALITELSTALKSAANDEERQLAVERANAALKSTDSIWRVEASIQDGQRTFTIEAIPGALVDLT